MVPSKQVSLYFGPFVHEMHCSSLGTSVVQKSACGSPNKNISTQLWTSQHALGSQQCLSLNKDIHNIPETVLKSVPLADSWLCAPIMTWLRGIQCFLRQKHAQLQARLQEEGNLATPGLPSHNFYNVRVFLIEKQRSQSSNKALYVFSVGAL